MNATEIGSPRLLDPFNWLEPFIPLVLAIHGSALLSATNGTPTQWAIVLLTFSIGLVGQVRRQAGAWETRARRIALFGCAWLMMVSHAGVASFFFFWLVVLTVTHPLLVPLKEGRYLPVLVALSYWALIPFSTSFPPRVVLINKFFHLNIVGYFVYSLAGFRARSVVRLWNAERALREKDQYYRLLAEHTSDLVGLHQPDGTIIYISPSVTRMLGYAPKTVVGQRFEDFLASDDDYSPMNLDRKNGMEPYRVRHLNGNIVWLETKLTEIYDRQGNLSLIQSTSRDVSERVAVECQLRYHALHDSLTHLPNRRCFMERFEQEVAQSRRQPDYGFALLQIDLDSFKEVNDSWGHAGGDRLLEKVSERIAGCIRDTDLVARVGGDEFIILMVPVDGIDRAEAAARRILSELDRPIELACGQEITIGASIGIALSSVQYVEPQDLIRYADIAMYRAKQEGKARFVTYNPCELAESCKLFQSELAQSDLSRSDLAQSDLAQFDLAQQDLAASREDSTVKDMPEATLGQS